MKLFAALLLCSSAFAQLYSDSGSERLYSKPNLGAKVGKQYRYDSPDDKPSVTHQVLWRTSQASMVAGIAINAINTPKIDKTFAIRSGVAVGFLLIQEWHTRRKTAKEAKERMMTIYTASNAVIGTAFGVTSGGTQ